MLRDAGFMKKGFTLIDVLISVAIIVMLFGGIYLIYFSIIDVINNIELRTAATSVVESELEIIRNIDYGSIGTVGGIPSGIIAQNKAIAFDNINFSVTTTIRNIDDSFDGTLGGNPNDTAPADYKLVEMEIGCPDCAKFVPLVYTATVSPLNLESDSNDGSIFIDIFDANVDPVAGAQIRVVNNSVSPTINLIDATNNNGVLQLVGVPTSTQAYEISVSLPGYASEQTYDSSDLGGSTPVTPHMTVAAQTVTTLSFLFDRSSIISVEAKDAVCTPIGNVPFAVVGTNKIGINPDVLRFSTSSLTSATSAVDFYDVPWDTYSFSMNDSSLDISGTTFPLSMIINPNSTINFDFILQAADPRSLLVTVRDNATGGIIPGATVTLSSSTFGESKTTNRSFIGHTNWSSGAYSDKSGIEVDSSAGSFELAVNASGTYTVGEVGWLISDIIDVGGSSSSFHTLNWLPTAMPLGAGADSARFQLASNNDNSIWNYIGPDGTSGTYYSSSGQAIHSAHSGDRYIRYKVYLETEDENTTPVINEVNLEFSGPCVPSSQVLFTNLVLVDDYELSVSASGYVLATSSVAVTSNWQQTEVSLTPQ